MADKEHNMLLYRPQACETSHGACVKPTRAVSR